MLIIKTVRNFETGVHGSRLHLKCDTCGKHSMSAYCDSHRDPDDWDRLNIPADDWSRRLTGRVLRDVCHACLDAR